MPHSRDTRQEATGLSAAALQVMPAATIITDGETVVFSNAEARRLFKCPEDNWLEGRQVSEIVHPDGHESMQQRGQVLANASISLRGLPVKLVACDGSCFGLVVSATPVDYEGRRLFMFTAEL